MFKYKTNVLQSVDIPDNVEKGEKEKSIQIAFIDWLKINKIILNEDEFKKKAKSISTITSLRNKIAHEFDCDEWNEEYWKTQKEIIFDVYDCLRTIREGLYNKLKSKIEIPYGIEDIRSIVMY